MPLTPHQARFLAHWLTAKHRSGSVDKMIPSLANANVDLNPHQVEAALFAFKSPLSKGAILADEVGLGKTIEAGIVIAQKWAERARRLLVICPSSLRQQWAQELMDKFYIPAQILDSQTWKKIDKEKGNPFSSESVVICSYNFIRQKQLDFIAHHWDLVVIDEAHRLRNVFKESNVTANTIRQVFASAPKILLTATPLQNTLLELFGLVSILDDQLFGDLESFREQYMGRMPDEIFDELKERIKPVCHRTLRKQVSHYIKFTSRHALTQDFIPETTEQLLYDQISEYLQRDELFALPSSQRQLITLIMRKLMASSTYAIANTLESLIKRLNGLLAGKDVDIVPELEQDFESYDETADEWTAEEPRAEYGMSKEQAIQKEINELEAFRNIAISIQQDAKGHVLLNALDKGFAETERVGGNRKAIIFTESRRTQEYITNILRNAQYKVVLFNGQNSSPEVTKIYQDWLAKHKGTDKVSGSSAADRRAALVHHFEHEAEIMIATEAAAEGINLQFCSLVVNYDLPWNPQRIEQRIGRCHRYGQKHDVVVINFLNRRNAADLRVFDLLNQKLHLFDGVFGSSDEILGAIESGVDFEKRILKIYQDCRTAEEIQKAFDELENDIEVQTRRTEELKQTRERLMVFDEDVKEKLKVTGEKTSLYLNRYEKRLWELTEFAMQGLADFSADGLTFTLKQAPAFFPAAYPGTYTGERKREDAIVYRSGSPLAQAMLEYLKGLNTRDGKLKVLYSGSGKTISVLDQLKGQSGYLIASILTIKAIEEEEMLLVSGFSQEGESLDSDTLRSMMEVDGEYQPGNIASPESEMLHSLIAREKNIILQDSEKLNRRYYTEEMEKLESWAEDKKKGLEAEIKGLKRQLLEKKKERRLAEDLTTQVVADEEIRKIEKQLREKRNHLEEAEEEIDRQKETLIDQIKARLNQTVSLINIFQLQFIVT